MAPCFGIGAAGVSWDSIAPAAQAALDCEDNQRPVARLAIRPEYREIFPGRIDVNGSQSFDPDGYIETYGFIPFARGLDENPVRDLYLFEPGLIYVKHGVIDNCGERSELDSLPVRVVEVMDPVDRTTFQLEGECGNYASGYSVVQDRTRSNNAYLAADGDGPYNTTEPPTDPATHIVYTVPDVAVADTGRYYLAGSFVQEVNCLWVSINGGEWVKWEVLNYYRSFYSGPPIYLVPGENTVRLAQCDPRLAIDQLILSPDTNVPNFYFGSNWAREVVNVPCNAVAFDEFWLEAECAKVGKRWTSRPDTAASNGGFVVFRDGNAYDRPPADDSANYVRFVVNQAEAGPYQLQARIKAPSILNDSYWVRVNGGEWRAWKRGIFGTPGFQWRRFPEGPLTLQSGTNTIDFAYREDGTQLDKIFLGSTRAPISGRGEEDVDCAPFRSVEVEEWVDVECARYGEAWEVRYDPAANQEAYLVPTRGDSRDAPPPDALGNQINMYFRFGAIQDSLPLTLYARVDAPSPSDDSFWVRLDDGEWYPWTSINHSDEGYQWNRLPVPLYGKNHLLSTLTIAYREDGAKLDRIYLTSYDSLPSLQPEIGSYCDTSSSREFAVEAECGSGGDGWQTLSSDLASRGSYVSYTGRAQMEPPTDDDAGNQLVYNFDTRSDQVYDFYLRLDAPDVGRNSFWIKVDDGQWAKLWVEQDGSELLTDGFEWRRVTDNGRPTVTRLYPGAHTIRVAPREPGTRLDKLYLAGPNLPGGFGGLLAPSCTPAPIPPALADGTIPPAAGVQFRQDSPASHLILYPNPVADVLTLDYYSRYTGRVEALLYDSQGRRLRRLSVAKGVGQLRTRLEVGDLPTGMYHLQLIAGEERLLQSFLHK